MNVPVFRKELNRECGAVGFPPIPRLSLQL